MTTKIDLPNQPVRPACKMCANYGGDAHLKRNGHKCVLCRLLSGWQVTPKRGTRSRAVLPCDYYLPVNKIEV